jgi:polyvinyl alcohol dehydrogenase (cytochrome)
MLRLMSSFSCLALCGMLGGVTIVATGQITQWPVAGQGAANLRNQPAETYLSTSNAASMVAKWVFTTSSDVSATPTVGTDAVFFPDWAGNLFAVDLETGALLWSHQISEYDGYSGALTRVSPALYNNSVIIGDNESGAAHCSGSRISIRIRRQSSPGRRWWWGM